MSLPHYRPDIDGLRALAVSAVVLHHAFSGLLPGGFVGVDVFFVISGYLISGILLNELKSNSFSLRDFYARRIRRIFPALTLILIACYLFGWISLYADEFAKLGKHMYHGAAFVSNFAFWQEGGYFDQAAETKPLNHLWSLGIEEQFYIAWPMMLWAAWKLWRRPLLMAGFILVGSLGFNVYLSLVDTIADFYSPLTRMWELLIGAVLSFASQETVSSQAEPGMPTWVLKFKEWLTSGFVQHAGPAAGFVLILMSVWVFDKTDAYPGWRALIPTLGAALILAGEDSWFNRAVLSLPAVRWIGRISYSLYLWHWPLLSFARVVYPKIGNVAIIGLVLLGVLLAYLTYVLVEMPVRRWKPRSYKVNLLMLPLALMALLGYNAEARNGLDFREVSLNYYLGKVQRYWHLEAASDPRASADLPGLQPSMGSNPEQSGMQNQNLLKLVKRMQSSAVFFKNLEADDESVHMVQARERERLVCQAAAQATCEHNNLQGKRIVILGDSHAGNLAETFSYAYPAVEFIRFVGTGCTPISRRYPDGTNRCGLLIKQALMYARDNHPDAIIFAARWPLDFEPVEKDLGDFGKYTQHLIVVGPGPEFTADPSHFLLRFSGGDAVQYINSFLLGDQSDKNQRMKNFFEKSGVGFINRMDHYCSPSFCPLTSNGEDLLIYDSNHLTVAGIVYLGNILADSKVLENLLKPQ